MLRTTTHLLIAALACVSAGCGDSNEWDLVDTTGERFHYSCTEDDCSISARDNECGATGSATGSTILQICTSISGVVYSENCRPVACTDDGGCRTSFDVQYKCTNGLCQRTDALPLDWDDLQTLCLADVPRTGLCQTPPFAHEKLGIAQTACPGDDTWRTCPTVPKECRQP